MQINFHIIIELVGKLVLYGYYSGCDQGVAPSDSAFSVIPSNLFTAATALIALCTHKQYNACVVYCIIINAHNLYIV